MHEVSIAHGIVETLRREFAGRPGRIRSVRVEVGALSGVVPEALRFAWDVVCAGTPLEGAALEILEIAVAVRCDRCGKDQALPAIDRLRCPECDAPTPCIVAGRELRIREVEIAEPPSPGGGR